MIAFFSNRDSNMIQIWVIPAAGGEARQLSDNYFQRGLYFSIAELDWSRDSRSICYVGLLASGERDLFRVPAAGDRPQQLGADRRSISARREPDRLRLRLRE